MRSAVMYQVKISAGKPTILHEITLLFPLQTFAKVISPKQKKIIKKYNKKAIPVTGHGGP
jgi:hypothetical protein